MARIRSASSWSEARPTSLASRAAFRKGGLKAGKPHLLCYLGVMGPKTDRLRAALARALRQIRPTNGTRSSLAPATASTTWSRSLAARARGSRHVHREVANDKRLLRHWSRRRRRWRRPRDPLNDLSTMNKILEYMAVGCPIVSFDLVEARVSAGEAAVYAEPNDTNESRGRSRPCSTIPRSVGDGAESDTRESRIRLAGSTQRISSSPATLRRLAEPGRGTAPTARKRATGIDVVVTHAETGQRS